MWRGGWRQSNFIAFAPDGLTSVGGYPGDDERGGQLFQKVDRPKMTEDFIAADQLAESAPGEHRPFRRRRVLFRRRDLEHAGSADAGPRRGRSVLRRRAGRGRCAEDQGGRARSPRRARSRAWLQAWPAYEAALKANNIRHEGYVYPKANHGFHNDTTPRYDEAAAKLAWQRTLGWFNKHLRS